MITTCNLTPGTLVRVISKDSYIIEKGYYAYNIFDMATKQINYDFNRNHLPLNTILIYIQPHWGNSVCYYPLKLHFLEILNRYIEIVE